MSKLTELIEHLCVLDGVSSFEEPVRTFLQTQAAPYADEMRVDPMGNLIVFKRGRTRTGNKLLLAAHMDEVGLIIKKITDEGYLKFSAVGGIDRRVLLGKPVRVGENALPGVIGLKAYHLVSAEEEKSVPKLEEFYIDIGAKDREEAERLVQPGDWAAFASVPERFGDGFLKAKALDDRIGLAVMLELLKEDLPLDVTFAFTVQEEVGTRGAFAAAFSVTPDMALVLETTTAADLAGAPAHKQVCSPGKGPVIVFMDGGSAADRGLYEMAREAGPDKRHSLADQALSGRRQRCRRHSAHQVRCAYPGAQRRSALSPRSGQRGQPAGFGRHAPADAAVPWGSRQRGIRGRLWNF